MSSIIDSLTQVYTFVAEFVDTHPNLAAWGRSHNVTV